MDKKFFSQGKYISTAFTCFFFFFKFRFQLLHILPSRAKTGWPAVKQELPHVSGMMGSSPHTAHAQVPGAKCQKASQKDPC